MPSVKLKKGAIGGFVMVKDYMESFNIDENDIFTKNKARTKKYVKERSLKKHLRI